MTALHDFHKLTIADVRPETVDAISLAFAVPPDLAQAFRFKPGQHLVLRATLEAEEVRRNYSICSGPDDGELRIAIKRVEGGLFSNHANDTFKAGQTIDVMPPQGRFVVPPPPDGAPRHILGVAAGAGITPIIGMAKQVLGAEPQSRFTLAYGNRSPEHVIFAEVLDALKDQYLSRFTLLHVLSRRGDEDGPLLTGRIDAAKIAALTASVLQPASIDHAFLCGPGTMIKDVRTALFAAGLARDRVHHEFFAAGGGGYRGKASGAPKAGAVAPAEAGAVAVTAMIDGRRHAFTMAPSEHVIDAAERAGIRVPYACKAGMCCTCRAKVLAGRVALTVNYSLEPWEVAQGFTLTCQAKPLDATLALDFDAM
jgi:ring-1,2-phenylacetyl-CoA epoxidase subunit PaaE